MKIKLSSRLPQNIDNRYIIYLLWIFSW